MVELNPNRDISKRCARYDHMHYVVRLNILTYLFASLLNLDSMTDHKFCLADYASSTKVWQGLQQDSHLCSI